VNIRTMETSDLPAVGALLASAWGPKITPYMISSQHGFKAFLEAKMTNPESLPWEWYVATDEEDKVIGFAEFDLTKAKTGLLKLIVVNKFFRGRGVATSLIERFVMSHNSLERLELDVFDDNYSACHLYEELGFIQRSQNVWLRRRIGSHSTPLHFSQSPPESAATHAAHGFSLLRLQWQGQDVILGRIGENVLRCFDIRSFTDDKLLAGAKATFASLREAMTVLPVNETDALPPDTFIIARSNHLIKTLSLTTGTEEEEPAIPNPESPQTPGSSPPSRTLISLPIRYLHLLHSRGFKRTLNIVNANANDALFELRYGVHTGRMVGLRDLEVVGDNRDQGYYYQAVRALVFRSAFDYFQIPSSGIFVDYGSGKGRALMLAIEYGFDRAVGIEFAIELCREAEGNLSKFRARSNRDFEARILNLDAACYTVNDDDCVFFLYDPFGKEVLEQVLSNIRHSLQSKPRLIHVVYAHPLYRQLLDDDPFWRTVGDTTSGGFDTFVYYQPR
jgi:ribosomal protein S18 acetylase RimI-like enzyme